MVSVRQRKEPSKKTGRRAWIVDYTDQQGTRKQLTPKPNTKAEADKLKRLIEKNPHNYANGFKPFTVADICERYLRVVEQRFRDGELSRSSVLRASGAIDNHIVPYLGKIKARDLSPIMVAQWIEGMRRKPAESRVLKDPYCAGSRRRKKPERGIGVVRSPTVIGIANGILRQALTEAQRLELIPRNVIKDVPPRLPRIATADIRVPSKTELKLILSHADGMMKPIVQIAITTGLRSGEIRALTWDAISFERNVITVRHGANSWTGELQRTKTKAAVRDVPMSPELAILLKEWKLQHKRNSANFLFGKDIQVRNPTERRVTTVGRAITYSVLHTSWSKLIDKACLSAKGEKRMHFHALRHAAASLWIEQGLTPQRLKQIMGHASIEMTFDRYGYLFPEDGTAAAAAANIGAQFDKKGA